MFGMSYRLFLIMNNFESRLAECEVSESTDLLLKYFIAPVMNPFLCYNRYKLVSLLKMSMFICSVDC